MFKQKKFHKNSIISFISLSMLSLMLLFNNCSQPGDIVLSNKVDDISAGGENNLDDPNNPNNIANADNSDPTGTSGGSTVGTGGMNGGGNVPSGSTGGTNNGGTTTMPTKFMTLTDTVTVNSITNKKMDILIVIDNSGSMKYEQSEMANRFSGFLAGLQGLDWQIGITTTDVVNTDKEFSDGKLLAFSNSSYVLTSQMDIELTKQLFAATIQRPLGEGSAYEQGIKATYRAIERALDPTSTASNIPNGALFRADANLAVVFVSDANETPLDGNFGVKNNPNNLLALIKDNWPNKIAAFHSIVVKTNDSECLANKLSFNGIVNSNESYGKYYEYISNETLGIIGNVCEADYSSQLKVMGLNIREKVMSIDLKCAPVDSDKDGKINFSLKDSAGNLVSGVTISGSKAVLSTPLEVGTYSVVYSCVDPN